MLRFDLALEHLEAGRTDEAAAEFKRVVAQESNTANAYHKRASEELGKIEAGSGSER
ncbi:MAG: hypothetical protein JKY65_26190 [Planctomycetes bacterium]|nr:hypothetical protein [Planctomycetota bacterium]